LHEERIKLWAQFNNCWLSALQREKQMLNNMIESGQRPQPPQTLIEYSYLESLGDALIKLCDQMEKHGLVDYEMGVWEEEIVASEFNCLFGPCSIGRTQYEEMFLTLSSAYVVFGALGKVGRQPLVSACAFGDLSTKVMTMRGRDGKRGSCGCLVALQKRDPNHCAWATPERTALTESDMVRTSPASSNDGEHNLPWICWAFFFFLFPCICIESIVSCIGHVISSILIRPSIPLGLEAGRESCMFGPASSHLFIQARRFLLCYDFLSACTYRNRWMGWV